MTWDDVATALAGELAALPAGAIVKLVEARAERPSRFAQFLQTDAELTAELIDDDHLAAELRAGRAGNAVIRELGWQPRDRHHENWWTHLPWPAPAADYRRLADMVVAGLRDGFGVATPDSFTYDAWNERRGNSLIELPQLGLPLAT
ncbi:TY-Chap domain-containing protein [Nocardia caishijiensis]|uniref:TY-Chap N-terminal domain-containing protein n=1 Tax=Nocardia caishijiensis TaxID=184756 RepID=A0ABQ6YR58_9NOCA|nr:hypothetical protein [Nocardia caishijiensis]KAF0848244.1 hypothetical protein FNL39_102392 [Nocardia caishijiensis]